MKLILNDPICNQKFKKYKWQGKGGNLILIFNKKLLIKKAYHTEINNIIYLNNVLDKTKDNFNFFFSINYRIYKCDNFYFILMKRYQDSIRYFDFNKINEFKNIILQILLFTLYLNFKLNYFHNDLHLNNVLYENDNKKFIVNLENVMLKVLKNKIKVIDWEHSDKKFIKKTVVYQKISKYFNDNLPDFEFIYLLISIISNFTIIDNKVVLNSYKSFEMNNYKKNMILKLIKILKNKYTLGSFINLYQYIDLNFYDIFSIN